jgi:hypothetical protein
VAARARDPSIKPGVVRCGRRFKAVRKGSNDDHDKFSLPTGPGFTEDILEVRARSLVSDAEFGLGGPQCFSCNEMKRQSGLGWRQAEVTPQQINGFVHDKPATV